MSFLTLNDGLNTNDKLSQLLKSLSRFKLDLETALEQQPCEEPLLNYKLSHINNQRARTPQNRDNRFRCNFEKRDRSSFILPVGGGRGGWMIQMATMVISDTTNMKIARERLPRKIFVNRSIIKLGKKLLQVKFSKGLLWVESPRSTTSI